MVELPEPPDGAVLYWPADTEADEYPVVLMRSDQLAEACGDPEARWFAPNSNEGPWTWDDDLAAMAEREGSPLGDAIRLVPQDEVDRLVAQARREAGVRPVGEHLIEPGGRCRTCGSHHSEQEIARLEDRLDAETG